MNRQENFRAFVPVMLNDRVVQWYYEKGEPRIAIEIPMRHYPEGPVRKWVPKHVMVNFDRRVRNHQPYKTNEDASQELGVEVYYVCDNARITFEEGNIPVVK